MAELSRSDQSLSATWDALDALNAELRKLAERIDALEAQSVLGQTASGFTYPPELEPKNG